MTPPAALAPGALASIASVETAYARRPQQTYQLPASIAATVPPAALPSSDELPSFLTDDGEDVLGDEY